MLINVANEKWNSLKTIFTAWNWLEFSSRTLGFQLAAVNEFLVESFLVISFPLPDWSWKVAGLKFRCEMHEFAFVFTAFKIRSLFHRFYFVAMNARRFQSRAVRISSFNIKNSNSILYSFPFESITLAERKVISREGNAFSGWNPIAIIPHELGSGNFV